MDARATRNAAYWIAPLAFCLALHWLSFRTWFRADDFAWLGLASHIHNWRDLAAALFTPMAQGTIRPWSERLFFIAGFDLFGLNALPYRIVIFATQFADIVLMIAIARRIAGSRAAGFLAAVLWMLNSAAVQPLDWACAYNEVLCAFFLLAALYARMRQNDALEWLAFLLGFGALELNIVYPAIAAAYSLFVARKRWRTSLPMFGVSAAYWAVHAMAAPVPKAGPYAMHFDGSMFNTLLTYWTWTIGPVFNSVLPHIRRWMLWSALAAMSIALAWFAWRKLREGGSSAAFCFAWYVVTLAPLLPLRDHLTEYYPYIPEIGICWLAGWALAETLERRDRWPRAAAAALVALYCVLMIPQLRALEKSGYTASRGAEKLIADIAEVHRAHPAQTILLAGMDGELFWAAMASRGFEVAGIPDVYLAERSRDTSAQPGFWNSVEYFLPPENVASAIVYDVRGRRLRESGLSRYVNPADAASAPLLGPEWYASEGDHRWMPKSATLRIGAPPVSGQFLHLNATCPQAPVTLTVTVNGMPAGKAKIDRPDFSVSVPLPDAVVGLPEMRVQLEVDRTFRPPGERRDLGAVFGTLEVR